MDALSRWHRAPQTLRSRVLRLVLVRSAAFGVLVATILVGQAMSVRPTAAIIESPAVQLPSWTAAAAAANPGCVQADAWRAGAPAASVVAYRFNDGSTRRIAFDAAWAANHNATDTDDVWVLGICG